MEQAKQSLPAIIFTLIASAVLAVIITITACSDEFAAAYIGFTFGIFDETIDHAVPLGKIVVFAFIPLTLFPVAIFAYVLSDDYDGLSVLIWFIFVASLIGSIVGFYYLTASYFSQIPVAEGTDFFKNFIDNFANIYFWYAFPITNVLFIVIQFFLFTRLIEHQIWYIVITTILYAFIIIILPSLNWVTGAILGTVIAGLILIVGIIIFFAIGSSGTSDTYESTDGGKTWRKK